MTDGPQTAIDQFESAVAPILHAYPSLDARTLAYKRDGATYNVFTKIAVSPRQIRKPKWRQIRAHPAFVIVQHVLPSTELHSILRSLRSGKLALPKTTIELSTPPRNPPPPNQATPPLYWHFAREFTEVFLWDGRTPSGEPLRQYTLTTYSGEGDALVPQNDLEALDRGLLSCRPRWLGVPDLVKRFLESEGPFTTHHSTTFSVTLPLRCEIGIPWYETAETLVVPVTAPRQLSTKELRLNALLTDRKGKSWTREGAIQRPVDSTTSDVAQFMARIPTKRATSVILHLLLKNRIVDKKPYDLWNPKSPNPRMATLKNLGHAMSQLEDVLTDPEGKGHDSETFEVAVSNLFGACGFLTLNPGRKHAKAGETVDIVAFHPLAPIVFCIECTWRVANNQDKLGKLHERTRDLVRSMPGRTVQPVLVMSKQEATRIEESEASALGVILLTASHLRTLRTFAEWDSGPTAVASWLLGNRKLKA